VTDFVTLLTALLKAAIWVKYVQPVWQNRKWKPKKQTRRDQRNYYM